MKKTIMIGTVLFAWMLMQSASAQITTKYGDNVSTLDGIMKAYYDVVTVPKGGRVYYERDSLLHWPGAVVGISGIGKDGKPKMQNMTLKEYHRLADPGLEKEGFDEREISRKVEKFGSLYHVWSTYESRNSHDGPVIERGINSIELFYDGTRFWVMTWYYDSERKGNPIPAAYLNK